MEALKELYDLFYDWLIEDRRDLKIKEQVQLALGLLFFMLVIFIAMIGG
jgi:hypothetical protein